jgi:predicted nucleic acid-binding protein
VVARFSARRSSRLGRRRGVQIGTIDALLARLCLRNDLTMLSTGEDFRRVARLSPLRLVTD